MASLIIVFFNVYTWRHDVCAFKAQYYNTPISCSVALYGGLCVQVCVYVYMTAVFAGVCVCVCACVCVCVCVCVRRSRCGCGCLALSSMCDFLVDAWGSILSYLINTHVQTHTNRCTHRLIQTSGKRQSLCLCACYSHVKITIVYELH